MTAQSPDMVVSGVPYDVLEVDGAAPRSLDDFVGEHVVLVEGSTGQHLAEGEGVCLVEGTVRYLEKYPGGGLDIRTWEVTVHEGGFCAETT